MSNTSIQLKKSGVTGNTPSGLSHGELAINYADGKLYYKNDVGGTSYISNQLSFDTINANNSLVFASGVSDTLSFAAGNNLTITTNSTTKTITFAADVEGAFGKANAAFAKANAAYTIAVSGGGSGIPVGGVYVSRTYTADGATSTYTVTDGVVTESIIVSENGVIQTPFIDYNVEGAVLTFNVAPSNTTTIQVRELGSNIDEYSRAAANSASDNSAIAFAQSNSALNLASSVYDTANNARSLAQSASDTANAAYDAAESGGSGSIYANAAFIQANAAFAAANSVSSVVADAAFLQANSAYVAANIGYNFVNTGGTISGNVLIANNLTVSGDVTLTDSLIYIAADNTSNTSDIGFVGSYTDINGYAHTGLVRDASDGIWKLFGNVVTEHGETIDFTNSDLESLLLGGLNVVDTAVVGETIVVGSKSGAPLIGATYPIIGAVGQSNSYIQSYVFNSDDGTSSSSDLAVYPNNGSDTDGWLDMGITSNNFSDASFSVTAQNEGYLLMSAPQGSGTSGNLILATDSTGTHNSIEVFIGGFSQGKNTPAFVIDSTKIGAYKPLHFSDDSIQQTAAAPYAHTNLAFSQANSAAQYANSSYVNSNAGFSVANTALDVATSAFIQANAAFAAANSANGGSSGITYTAANTAPSSPSTGDQWYSQTEDILYEYITDGTSSFWLDVSSDAISSGNVYGSTSSMSWDMIFLTAGI